MRSIPRNMNFSFLTRGRTLKSVVIHSGITGCVSWSIR